MFIVLDGWWINIIRSGAALLAVAEPVDKQLAPVGQPFVAVEWLASVIRLGHPLQVLDQPQRRFDADLLRADRRLHAADRVGLVRQWAGGGGGGA